MAEEVTQEQLVTELQKRLAERRALELAIIAYRRERALTRLAALEAAISEAMKKVPTPEDITAIAAKIAAGEVPVILPKPPPAVPPPPPPAPEWHLIEHYRDWDLYQYGTELKYEARREGWKSIEGVDLPDLRADIDETYRVVAPPPAMATITGIVTDEVTGAGLVGATVKLDTYTARTERDGSYTLSLPAGSYTGAVDMTGYASVGIAATVEAGKTYTLNAKLTPPVTMPPTTVRFQVFQAGRLIGTYSIPADQFEAVRAEYTKWGLTVVKL